MTPFQTGGGGVKGKGITGNLFILKRRYGLPFMTLRSVSIVCGWRIVLTHCMKIELKNDILDLIYKIKHKAESVVKTPFGDCNPIFVENIVRQSTVLGLVLNNCSLDKVCHESEAYQSGTVNI